MHNVDDPAFQDNRKYNYNDTVNVEREEYKIIASLVPEGAKIIDLGCGNGSLIEVLINKKNVSAVGVDISDSGISECKQKGLNAVQGEIDKKLDFKDDEFDYAICNVTIQMVNYPEILLSEMKRIAKHQIISFPNFAFYKNRLELLFKGKMPGTMLFGYKWFNSGHLHQLSIKDFKELLCQTGNMKIIKHEFVPPKYLIQKILMRIFPNLFQYIPIFVIQKIKD